MSNEGRGDSGRGEVGATRTRGVEMSTNVNVKILKRQNN